MAILVLVVVMYVIRPRGHNTKSLDLPAQSLALALLLLTFNPTKSPYHFGSVAVLGAVGAAAECHRLLATRGARHFPLRPLLITSLTAVAVAGSFLAEGFWNALDLRVLNWDRPTALGIDLFSSLPWLVVGAAAVASIVVLHLRNRDSPAPWRVGAWSMPAAALIVVGLTAAVMVADTVRSDWSLTRQNLAALTGSGECGLAESVHIGRSLDEGVTTLSEMLREEGVIALLEPAPAPYFPCADTPTFRDGAVEVPKLVVGWENQPWPIAIPGSPFAGVRDLYGVRRIYYDDAKLAVHEVRHEVIGGTQLPAVVDAAPGS